MPNDNESTKWLYEQLTKKGYNVGKDQAEFDNLMATNEESRKWAYETAQKSGLNVGKDIDEFTSLVAPAPAVQPQEHVQETPASLPAPAQQTAWEPSGQEKAAALRQLDRMSRRADAVASDTKERIGNMVEYGQRSLGFNTIESKPVFNPRTGKVEKTYLSPTGSITTDKDTAEKSTRQVRKSVEDAKVTVDKQLAAAEAEQERLNKLMEARKREIDKEKGERPLFARVLNSLAENSPNKVRANMPADTNQRYRSDEQFMQLEAAARKNNLALQTLRDKKNGKMNNFWHSVGTTLMNGYSLTGGASDMYDASALMSAKYRLDEINRKREAGKPLTDEEKASEAVLRNAVINEQVQGMYGGEYGAWSRAGAMTATSIDLMKDIMLTPGAAGFSKAVASKTAGVLSKGVAKVAGEKVARNIITRGLLKGTGILVGAHAGGALVTNVAGIGHTLGETGKELSGRVAVDDNGGYKLEDQKDLLHAFAEAERRQIGENGSEMFGEFIPGAGKLVTKGLEKMGLSKVSNALTRIGNREWFKQYSALLSAGGYSGLPGEAIEEYEGMLFDAITGNAKETWEQVKDPRTHVDIWLGCATMGALMGSAPVVMQGYQTAQYYRYKHKTDVADKLAAFIITPERWEPMREKIDETENGQMADVVMDIINDGDMEHEEKKAALDYVRSLQNMRGYNIAEANNAGEEKDPEKQEANESYKGGHEAAAVLSSGVDGEHTEDEVAEAQADVDAISIRMQEADEGIEDAFGADGAMVEYVKASLNEDPWKFIGENELTEDQRDAVLYYINAKAALDGVMDASNEAADMKRMEVDQSVKKRTHKDGGVIVPATMKVDDRPVYVVKGDVVMFPDGSGVDVSNSSESVVVMDAQTGEYEFTSPDQIFNVSEAVDPQEELDAAMAAIEQERIGVFGENVPEEVGEAGSEGEVGEVGDVSETGNNGGEIIPENGNIGAYNIPVGTEAQQTALSRIPVNEQGEPMFESVDRDTAWDGLVEAVGGEADASEIAMAQIQQASAELEKLKKKPPMKKTPKLSGSPMAMAQAKREAAERYQQELDAYNQQVADTQSRLDAWNGIVGVYNQRRADASVRQEAEARRLAAERAAAEKAEQEARAEAERQEREALEGVPEWHLDTPENARKRGARRYQGQLFERQGALVEGLSDPSDISDPSSGVGESYPSDKKQGAVIGKEVEVKFSQKDLPKGRVAVIEAERLQPSHVQGQRNPMFFIEEAQPKNRAEVVSTTAARDMAEGIRPQEITGSATAYTGAPTVNARGEVIQGNNRSDALRYLWKNELPEQQQAYKQYLLDHAEQFGLDGDAVGAMQHPVLVNMLDVDDAEAIRLGQLTAQDTESGGVERIKPKNVAQKLGENMRTFANRLLSSADEEATFGQLVDKNGEDVLKWMTQTGAISNTQYQSAFDSNGNLTAEAKNDLQKVLYQSVFKGGSQQLEEMFDKMPAKAQRAILATAFRDMDSPLAGRMLPEIQSTIIAYHALMQDSAFASAKNMEEVLRAVDDFKRQTLLDDRLEQYMPADNFSNFALHLAGMYKAGDKSQTTIASYFNQMYDLAQGKKAATLFDEADTTEHPLTEVIKQVLGIDYKPAKNGNNNVADGGNALAVGNQDGQGGESRNGELPGSGEQAEGGAEAAERGGGTSNDSHERGRNTNVNGGAVNVEANGGLAEEITPVVGPFGEIYTQFKGKSQEAIAFLLTKKSGEAVGALHHKEIGDIDLVYGKEGTGHSDGYALAKLAKYHPEVLNNLQDILDDMVVTKRSENRVQLESEKYQAAVRLTWDNKNKTWLLTMFEKKNSALDNTTDTGKTLVGNGNGTATPENTVLPKDKGTKSFDNQYKSGEKIQGLDSYSRDEVLEMVRADVEQALSDAGFYAEVVGLELHGSRMRGDAREDSDLDVVVEYRGKERENDVFNLLHDEPFEIDGVTIDINPIRAEESGTLAKYMEKSAKYDAEVSAQKRVKSAEAEVNTNPTPAQAEAGNYKKGHVTIGDFDITIENPAGSVRKGVDANGKEWQTTMANTYGYFKGTEGVDGDHIDVFLHTDMDQWNGRKVYVMDQTNRDGSFDEHKVMLGFNDKDEAMSAYLANYDATWAETHPGLRISETNIEDFNKWIESSHRKTKPFAEYKGVKKETTGDSGEVRTGDGYRLEKKPYTNKQDKTLDTYLVTFDREMSKEDMSALRAKAKAMKGWYDRDARGWMLRSEDDAKTFADEFVGKTEDEVADEAPLSMADMEKQTEAPVKKVDVSGVFDALKTKGEAKLSDHAEIADQTKPKKRKWISDEDAAEFDSLREGLRNHFGKDGSVAMEDAVSYGKPQPKQMDAEVLRLGTRMTYLMMKGGLRSFSDYCEAMKDELPDIFEELRPHLKSLYAATQNMEEVMQLGWDEEMDDRKTVKAFDVYNFDKTGAKDLIGTAQHTVDERASQQQTDQIIQTIKDQRNEQRRKEADETSANTKVIVSKAKTIASKVESELEDARAERDAERLSRRIDEGLEEVNEQLSLLGYYEADEVDKEFNEAYGFMRNAERKATQDAHRLATQLAADLGLAIDPKDKVRKSKHGFGSKIAHSNVAPAGGEVYITLPIAEGRELAVWVGLEPADRQEGDAHNRPYYRDDLYVNSIMFRVEDKTGEGSRYITGNGYVSPTATYDELLAQIRRSVRHLLPEQTVQPAEQLTRQPGEDMVQVAERVVKDRKEKKQSVKPEQLMGDLFGGLFDNGDTEAEKPQSLTNKTKANEKTGVQSRSEETGRGGQQPRPDESLGAGATHEDERVDGGRVAERGGEHFVLDTERSEGVSQPSESGERRVKSEEVGSVGEGKNLRNNHAERGVDYAPKGEKARIDANLAAIELSKKLLASGQEATPKDMEVLRRYSGWGGLGAAFNEGKAWAPNPINKRLRELLTPEEYEAAVMSRNSAYYTPAPVIDALWDIAKALGFKGGNILEGSAGIGNIIGLMPTDISERSNIHAVEIDGTTGGILSLLYPDAHVEVQGFEKTRIGNGTVDLAITNVPFVTDLHVMDESGDKDLSKKFRDIHDFCIAKNVRKLREGGIGIFITSSGTLDKSQKLRNWLVSDKEGNADVVGAFRMNNQTFGGTPATSDTIVVRKRVNGRKSVNAIDVSTVSALRTASYEDEKGKIKELPLLINRYFIEHPENMGGEMFFGFEQGDTYRPKVAGLFPVRGADQAGRMTAWVKRMEDMDWSDGVSGRSDSYDKSDPSLNNVNDVLGEGVKEGSMVIDSEGNLCVARMGRAVPLGINSNKFKGRTKEECFKDYTEIKSALADVLKYQTEHEDDAGLQPLLDRLNRAYDTFVERYGNLNKNNNLAWLRNDVDFSSIVALETYSEKVGKDGKKTKIYGKTDIFSRRVVEKEIEPAPKNVKDGIIASIYKFGRIDLGYIADSINRTHRTDQTHREGMDGIDDVKREIISSGLGFENPTTGQMEVSYEYLSGNVREKLRQAREANETAGGAYDANIKALEAVVPMNIPAHLIEFTLGSSWVEPKLYERYIKERTGLDVTLTNAGGTWSMSEPYYTNEPKNMEMGVRSEKLGIFIPGHKLIDAALTNKTITVSKSVKDSEGTHTETDPSATNACAAKVDEIRQDFKDWARAQMQSDPDLSMHMEEVYNEQFNNSVPKTIPDEFIPEHFGGAATMVVGKPFHLRPHQAKAVIRATTQSVLLAHEVGTGKTYTLITTAMEMRRLGTARKPMIVVQNATVGQFVASAKALYPNAKVLTLEDADRNAEGRMAFYAKIKYNDWDMIVVPQSVFERIPDSIERQTQFIQDKIEEKLLVLEQMKEADPHGKSQIVRSAEREINNLSDDIAKLVNGGTTDKKKEKDAKKAAVTRQNAEVKAKEMLDRETDDVEDFDSMGVDAILVDEAHEYKHLGFATAMQRGVKGVDPSDSKKSQGVFLKTQAVLEKTGGKNVVFATGTPISNTAAEIWTFMRYLMPADVMKDYGIYYFDDFVRNFGNLQQMFEFTTSGKYKENNRFAGYVNLPELVRIWSTVADTVLTRDAGGVSDKIPQMEGGKAQDIFLPQTRALRSIMKYVKSELDAYDKMSGKEKKENSHIPLVMYGIAKAAAVDARLVQSDAEDDQNSKTNEAVRHTLRALEETKDYKGTVAIFADNYQNKTSGFNLYEDIRKKLIDAGVPAEQIVVMKSGMSVNKKLDIFSRVNSGDVRVVMGSTFTLGTGVNIQERLNTLIHLDAPNRPMDYTQRNGRILRQGNLHNEWGMPVRVLRFGVEDSLDVTAYQRLKTKGAIADSIMNGKQLMDNSMETRSLEEDQDLFGDITAQLSGSEYALLKNQVEKEVRKLTTQLKQWETDQTYIHNRKRQIEGQNKEAEKRIADNKSYLAKVEAATIGDITVGNQSFPFIEAMEDFFTEQNKKKAEMQEQIRKGGYSSRPATSDITISVGGFDFNIHTEITRETKSQQGDLFYTAPAKMTYSCSELGIQDMPVKENKIKNAVTEIMDNVVSGEDFRGRIEAAERFLERNNAELQSISSREGVPFKHTDELAKAEEKLAEYEELMNKEMEAKEAKYAEMDKDVETATNVELTEEDEEEVASEPIASYSGKNTTFASSYETEDGKTINYTSESPEAYGVSDVQDGTADDGTGADGLQREGDNLLSGQNRRLNADEGEFCLVERVFTENGSFNFTSGERIESADDVAYIFSSLEDAAKEHSFIVYVKNGRPTVVELGMGTFNSAMIDLPTASLAYNRIRPDEVYFVHNHPSGNLTCSPQDVSCLREFEDMSDVPVYGVIINLKTGKYGTFDTDSNSGVGNKRAPETENKLTVHTLDKQIFAPDYDPMAQPLVRSSEDVASFLNSQRMGDRAKVSFLILNRAGRIVGNIHTQYTEISSNPREVARYISDRVTQFGGATSILYGDFPVSDADGRDYRRLQRQMKEVGGNQLLDVVRVEGNHTKSANDEGILYEPESEYGESNEGNIRFRDVENPEILKEFADGKTVKAYRTMQVIDGKLYSPMATKVGGKSTPEIKLGVPEQSEEHPEIIKGTKIGRDGIEQGYVVIDKGLGKGTLTVAYNPYAHTSRTVLNDQFSSAYIRPNLVTVEVEVPESELTSSYRAPMAKDAVGEIAWHSGSVSGQLAELGRPRRVILTRYDRPVRIVPFREVAEMIAAQLDGTDISIPYNVVQPQLRTELERLGVAISDEASGSVGNTNDFGKAEYITDQEIERINAHQQEMANTSLETKAARVRDLSEKLHTPIRIISEQSEIDALPLRRQREAKGWWNARDGEIVVVLPNHANVSDVENTVVHEVVGHEGLRALVGKERFDAFLGEVYGHASDAIREAVDRKTDEMVGAEADRLRVRMAQAHERAGEDANASYYADMAQARLDAEKKREAFRREATEEYMADMAGRIGDSGFEKMSRDELTLWGKIKAKVQSFLDKFMRGLGISRSIRLSDKDLAYILYKSWKNLRGGGMFADAEDAVMRRKTGWDDAMMSDASKMEKTNKRFNRELSGLTEENADKVILSLGRPSAVLRSAGVEDKPMKLYGNKVIKKMKKHGFALSKLENLPLAVASPIAVFDNYHKTGNRSILTELRTADKHIIVSVIIGKDGVDADFNIVSSVFGKGNSNIIDWLNKGYATYINKEKALDYLHFSKSSILEASNNQGLELNLDYLHHSAPIAEALSNPRLSSAAKVVKDFENPTLDEEENVRFRDSKDYVERNPVIARALYEKQIQTGLYQFTEAMQDSMRGLKEFYKAVESQGEQRDVEEVPSFENAYIAENLMSSRSHAEMEEFENRLMRPLLDIAARLAGNKRGQQALTDYLMAKHGLERNAYMRSNAAANDEDTDRDFSGLCGLTGTDDWQETEAIAQEMVDDFESTHSDKDISDLWSAINKATKASLKKVYDSGLLSKEQYEKIRDMYKFYVPLRGFDEKTSDDVYGYLTSRGGAFSSPIRKAEGRKSKADDPIATIAYMAQNSIMQGNRNMMKQKFLTYVHNHPSDLASVNRLWLMYDEATDTWKPVFADIDEQMSPDEIEQEVKDFEERMEALSESEPDKYKRGRDAVGIPYRIVDGNLKEHQVVVKRNGESYVITINGNPRAAQAVNGLTNPDNDLNGAIGKVFGVADYVNRQLSQFYTTRNPDFVVSNFVRDLLYANTMVHIKESQGYAMRFHKNHALANPMAMVRLLYLYDANKLDMGNTMHRMFYEFMHWGGETGYTMQRDLEQEKKLVDQLMKEARRGKLNPMSIMHLVGSELDLLNRGVENSARFAAFMTSREVGRDVQRSAFDAKEISVNFNKKGSGSKFIDAKGQTSLGKTGAFLSGIGRSFYVFWNAAIQGTTNFGKAYKKHPAKAIMATTALLLLGYVLASMNDDGDDEDKSGYYNMPKYIRRSNLMFRIGEQWLSVPLPVEYRAIYGLGELAYGVTSGREEYSTMELAKEISGQLSQILPVDFMEGDGGMSAFVPSAFKPTFEVMTNKSWTGMPIYKDTPFNKDMPEWTKAYAGANKQLVDLSKWLNEATGGNDYTKGWLDFNPAQLEYLLNGYFGGYTNVADKMVKTGEIMFGEREYDPSSILLVNRLVKIGDERTEEKKINSDFYKYLEEYKNTHRLMKKYEEEADRGSSKYNVYLDALRHSRDGARHDVMEEYISDYNWLTDAIKDTDISEEERAQYHDELRRMKREVVSLVKVAHDSTQVSMLREQFEREYVKQ